MKLGDFLISEVIFQFGFILEKCARCSSEVNSLGIVILNTFFKDTFQDYVHEAHLMK